MQIKHLLDKGSLQKSGEETLLHIINTLLNEFAADLLDVRAACHTPHTVTLQLIPRTVGVVPDPYTSIFCHVKHHFLNRLPSAHVYEEFCQQVGDSLQNAFLLRREPKRRRPQITMVLIPNV